MARKTKGKQREIHTGKIKEAYPATRSRKGAVVEIEISKNDSRLVPASRWVEMKAVTLSLIGKTVYFVKGAGNTIAHFSTKRKDLEEHQ